jgi:uncharacterized OsmC-like protein
MVIVRGGVQGFAQEVSLGGGRHHLIVDEPISSGGTERGADPYQLIAAALGS